MTTSPAPTDCSAVCAGQGGGTAGECCSTEYCDCSDLSLASCSGEEQYCPALGLGCHNLYGGDCEALCCDPATTTQTTATATTTPATQSPSTTAEATTVSTSTSKSTTATTPPVTTSGSSEDCSLLCAGLDSGTAGACCGLQYCDCSEGSMVTCPGEEQYCPGVYDACHNMYGSCEAVCCS